MASVLDCSDSKIIFSVAGKLFLQPPGGMTKKFGEGVGAVKVSVRTAVQVDVSLSLIQPNPAGAVLSE
jgi:hypothetical protein